MPQTVLSILHYGPCAPEVSARHHTRYSNEAGSGGEEIRQETTRIQQQHIRGDVGTVGLVVPNEPQQSSGCLLFVADSVLLERFEHDEWRQEGILATLSVQPSHWLLYSTEICPGLKSATLGPACNIDLTDWRSEWEQNPAKELKKILCWANGKMRQLKPSEDASHKFEGNVDMSWLKHTQWTKRLHFLPLSHTDARMIEKFPPSFHSSSWVTPHHLLYKRELWHKYVWKIKFSSYVVREMSLGLWSLTSFFSLGRFY